MPASVGDSLDALQNQEPSEPDREAAARWLAIYAQLIDLTVTTLAQTHEHLKSLSEPARRHVLRTNVAIMEAELARFYDRRRVLATRLKEMSESGRSAADLLEQR